MDAKELFDEKLPQMLVQAPDKARALNAIYFFHITGEGGGSWTVDLKANPPAIRQGGDAASAECGIEISAEDFKTMIAEPQRAIEFYFQQKLLVSGDPNLAAKLQGLFSLGQG